MYSRFNAMYACQTHISNPLMPYVTPFFPSLITVVLKFFRQSTTIPPSNYLLSKLITPASIRWWFWIRGRSEKMSSIRGERTRTVNILAVG